MTKERLSMRKIKEVLRLKFGNGLSDRQTAISCCISRSTVAEYISRAEQAGLTYPVSEGMGEAELEKLLFPLQPSICTQPGILPDWSDVYEELKNKNVTKALLWEEYKERTPQGYQYSQFCELYREWLGKLSIVMRQDHKAGEKLFVDYCGATIPVTDPNTGEVKEAQIFVAVLGASNYTYTEAAYSQGLYEWITAHVHAFEYFGGVPEIIVPDNLLSGVSHACRYEPDLNPTYRDMAYHYGTTVMPARVRKPRDKAKVEAGVQLVQRWIVARLRHETFFSLSALNTRIKELLIWFNDHPFKKLDGTRASFFERIDKPALRPLPIEAYEYAEWKKARVNIDYHIEVDKHYYSVPYQLVREQLDVRITAATIECFYKNKRVASHIRSDEKGRHTTMSEHMPKAHQEFLEWTPERLVSWATKSGEHVSALVEKILSQRAHPQQGFRSVLGIMRLGKRYGDNRLDAACKRALEIGGYSYKSIESILKQGLDQKTLPKQGDFFEPIEHSNIRGSGYYQ
ncbi:MAG: IS21 family transposase [Deltaproteobacteria bacterium]|nr:IS21 family transposase [Deltaproteobacteria bacterium]